MKRIAMTAGALAVATGSWAQADWSAVVSECEALADKAAPQSASERDAALGACVREKSGALRTRLQAQKVAEEKRKNDGFRVFLRDSSTAVVNPGGSELGAKGASLSILYKDGEDHSLAQVGLFGYWNARDVATLPVQPFIGASWQRDPTATPKNDIRDLTAGVVTQPWGVGAAGGFIPLIILQGIHRTDLYGTKDGTLFRAHADLLWPPLSRGTFSIVPHVAGLWHRRTEGGAQEGWWRSAYAGVVVSANWPLPNSQSITTSLLARRFYDVSVPDGNEKRRDKYLKLGLDYNLFDVNDTNAAFQPSLFLQREIGENFLTGVSKANKTSFGIRVKLTH
ncbi:MAG: hypothetical protein IPK34_13220 [Ramlibacter sp.]|nr:hypothetical protein [Ramlibacter sp.]